MALKINGKFKCIFCDYTHTSSGMVDAHRDTEHDYVLVPMLQDDLARLIQFMYTKEDGLITERLYVTLRDYLNHGNRRKKNNSVVTED